MVESGGAGLKTLQWDSNHFGFKVGRIECRGTDMGDLERLLAEARTAGYALVYWGSETSLEPDPEQISRLGGRYVATNVIFARDCVPKDGSDAARTQGGGLVRLYGGKDLTEGLRQLALEAGAYSRFRVDPKIGWAAFEGLYTTWIRRSIAHELADVVLVSGPDDLAPAGFITVSLKGQRSEIGLLAVGAVERGRGIGSALVRAAIGWGAERDATLMEVATQLENRAACSLYERTGFRRARASRMFHFWLQ